MPAIPAEESSAAGSSCDLPTSRPRGSSFKFGAAVAGISKGAQDEAVSYYARGDGKFQDGSNIHRQ